MTFRVGQKVTRISDKPWRNAFDQSAPDFDTPAFGAVYVINHIEEHDDYLFIFLEGFRGGYYAARFRPLVERKTELPASLTALLDPTNHVPLKEPAMTGG